MPRTNPSRWLLPAFVLAWLLSACTPQQALDFAVQAPLAASERELPLAVTVYHPDPHHLWNRLFAHFYVRIAPDGTPYGQDGLDPLLWSETTYLLDGPSHTQALALLDAFLAQDSETWIDDPLKRALLQRDLWAVFDWTTLADAYPEARQALQARLAAAMQQLALSRAEIEALPDNYRAAVASEVFPARFQAGDASSSFAGDAYLPPDLFAPDKDWVHLGREDGPMAVTHVNSYPFLGRATFLVFARLPDGREASENFVQALGVMEQLGDAAAPPYGTELALVRQMMLIDDQGELVLSPLVETVQVRHRHTIATSNWHFYEFRLGREQLFSGEAGGLIPLAAEDAEFPTFMGSGVDWFERESEIPAALPSVRLNQCGSCHTFGMRSIISVSRHRFPLPDEASVVVRETTAAREAQFTMEWKQAHKSWARLKTLLTRPRLSAESASTVARLSGVKDVDALVPILLSDDKSALIEHIQFTELPCTHQRGLGGPPKCEEGEDEGTSVDVFPILGQSGTYLRRSQIDGLILNAASVLAIYRVAADVPGEGWPPGEYGIIVLNADELPPAITVFVAGDKIVRATYHMGKFPYQVLDEITGEILYVTESSDNVSSDDAPPP